LQTLTDPISIKGRLGVPTSVPSGLPVPTID
jgi:cytochrome c peroxidase